MAEPTTIRTFIAVALQCPPRLAVLLEELAKLGRAVRAVSVDHLHLTLRFLGETPLAQVAALGEAMRRAASETESAVGALAGIGAFPNEHRPSVVWVAVEPAEMLCALERRLAASLDEEGWAPEPRPFHPHVTVARVKARPPERLLELIRARRRERFGAMPVRCLDLIRSDLRPEGPCYTTLDTAPLGGGE
jgi:2'-5' RNA ligase